YIFCALKPRDEIFRDDAAVQMPRHPARGLCRAYRSYPNDQKKLPRRRVLCKARRVAARHPRIDAELGLHELCAGLNLSGETLGTPARRRINGQVRRANEKWRAPRDSPA